MFRHLRRASHDANGYIELTLKKSAMLVARSLIAKGFAMNEKLMLYGLNYHPINLVFPDQKFCILD